MREIITMGDVAGAFGAYAHTRYLGAMGDPAVVGSPAQVVNAPDKLHLRTEPSVNAALNSLRPLLNNGEEVGVIDTRPGDNGDQWFHVVVDAGNGSNTDGWCDGNFLADVGAPPLPVPPPPDPSNVVPPLPSPPPNILPPDPGGQIVPVGPAPVAPSASGGIVAQAMAFAKAHPIPVAVGAVVVVGAVALAMKKKKSA